MSICWNSSILWNQLGFYWRWLPSCRVQPSETDSAMWISIFCCKASPTNATQTDPIICPSFASFQKEQVDKSNCLHMIWLISYIYPRLLYFQCNSVYRYSQAGNPRRHTFRVHVIHLLYTVIYFIDRLSFFLFIGVQKYVTCSNWDNPNQTWNIQIVCHTIHALYKYCTSEENQQRKNQHSKINHHGGAFLVL